jgi:hypothetical protein
VVTKAVGLRGDEETVLWATASLGGACREGRRASAALLEVLVEELAFDLGARTFPPEGSRASRSIAGLIEH